MQIEKVNCLVSIHNEGLDDTIAQVVKSGPSAISVTEIPLLRMLNGPNSVTRVHSAGFFETEKRQELERIARIYPKKVMNTIYPGLNAPLPKTIAEADLSPQHLHDAPVEDANVVDTSQDDEIAVLKAKLAKAEAALIEKPDAPVNDTPQISTEPETKAELRDALVEAGVKIPLGNHGIPALKAMMPAGA